MLWNRPFSTHIFLLVFFCLLPSRPAAADTVFEDEAVRHYLSDLLREGGMGRLPRERAAFLTVDEAGIFRCLIWPKTGAFNSESFNGHLPAGIVAIAHTHPRESSLPSSHDRAQATRLQIPFIVLTPRTIEVAMPGGSRQSVVRNERWLLPVSEIRCERMSRE